MPDIKTCTKCGEAKSFDLFSSDKQKRDGKSSHCKTCKGKAAVDYQRRNPDVAYRLTKAWRERNREQFNAKNAEWARSPKGKESRQAWYEKNKEKVHLYNRARKAMRRGMRKKVTTQRIEDLMQLQKCKCVACRASLEDGYHVDHIMPIALGGDSSPENLQLLCPTCNCSKRAEHPVDFMQRKGMLL